MGTITAATELAGINDSGNPCELNMGEPGPQPEPQPQPQPQPQPEPEDDGDDAQPEEMPHP
jgi:hypothetical protein